MILSLSRFLFLSFSFLFSFVGIQSKDKEFMEIWDVRVECIGEIFVLEPVCFLVNYHARTKIVKKQKGTD